jgi:hypothetical protein
VIGSLTFWETQALVHEQRHINHYEHTAWSDGVWSPRDRRHINFMRDRASSHIYRLKHNPWHR